jgi:hypothetical protein
MDIAIIGSVAWIHISLAQKHGSPWQIACEDRRPEGMTADRRT